jgi:hypothetical protein
VTNNSKIWALRIDTTATRAEWVEQAIANCPKADPLEVMLRLIREAEPGYRYDTLNSVLSTAVRKDIGHDFLQTAVRAYIELFPLDERPQRRRDAIKLMKWAEATITPDWTPEKQSELADLLRALDFNEAKAFWTRSNE